jgi:Outer membrane protein
MLLTVFYANDTFAQGYKKNPPAKTPSRDTVRRVIPPQVYGNPKAARRADSIAKAKAAVEQAASEAARKAEEERLLEEKKRVAAEKSTKKPKIEMKKNTEQPTRDIKRPIYKTPEKKIEPEQIKKEFTTPTQAYLESQRTKSYRKQGAWELHECVQYAKENNLQVAEAELNERFAKLAIEQNIASCYPNLNGDFNIGESYGRNIDPTSNQFVTQGFLYNTTGLSSQVLLFGWFQKKYQIEQSKYDLMAADFASKQLKEDIALNVATGFLRVLLAREQVKISENQLNLDNQQYNQTLTLVKAGKLPELNAAQMLAQLSADSANLLNNRAEERIALLQLRALMNFGFEENFDIKVPGYQYDSVV